MQKSQAPGFYRMMLGDFDVTVVSDGTVALPMGSLLTNIRPGAVKNAFGRAFIKDPVETSVNVFVATVRADRAIASYGHTPGHAIFSVESRGERLVLWGDLMHVAAAQFPNPAVTIKFDTDSKAAKAQRQKAFADSQVTLGV